MEEVSVVPPNKLKPTVVVGAAEFEGVWPKAGPPGTLVVAVTVAEGGFPNWNTGPGVAKVVSVLGAELAGPPNRKGCDVAVDVAAVTAGPAGLAMGPVEAGGLSPKLKTGLMVASVEELCVAAVVAAVVKMTLGRPVNPARVAVEAAGSSAAEAGCDGGLKAKGEALAGDEAAVVTLPKMGLNTVVVEDVEEGPELADTVTAGEMTAVQAAALSLFGKAPKMGLKTGAVVGAAVVAVGAAVVAVVAGWLAGGVFATPKRMLGLGKVGGLLGVGPSSGKAGGARLLGVCAPRAEGAAGAARLSTGTGLVSAEVAGRALDSSDTAGAGGCAADEGSWEATAAPVESGKGESAYLGTRSPTGTHPTARELPEQHPPIPARPSPAAPNRPTGSVSPNLFLQDLPAEHWNREFSHLPPTEAAQSSCCTCPADHPPPLPHLPVWGRLSCSASSSGCPAVRGCQLGQEPSRPAQVPGRSQGTPAAWTRV